MVNLIRKSKNIKGQLKIQQMAFMLMAVTLFLILAGMFMLVIKLGGLKNTATALAEKNAILLVTKLANSPEFSCGLSFDNTKLNCIDEDKVMALKSNIDKYKDFWDISNIEIQKIYPAENIDKICTSSNYPNCGKIILRNENQGIQISNFVSLCRKEPSEAGTYNKCELAKLSVSYQNIQ